jgi:formylmethanofuran dehydrogenase subunit D
VAKLAASESTLFVVEEKAQVNLAQEGDSKEGVWYLDSGATNHMTSDRAAFAELNTSVTSSIKFGDGSTVDISGQGTVLFVCKSDEHRAITGVYYIPRLNTHIISLG